MTQNEWCAIYFLFGIAAGTVFGVMMTLAFRAETGKEGL